MPFTTYKGNKYVTFKVVATGIGIFAWFFNILAAVLGTKVSTTPFAVDAKDTSSMDRIFPGEGVGNNSISRTTGNSAGREVGNDDYLVVAYLWCFVDKNMMIVR